MNSTLFKMLKDKGIELTNGLSQNEILEIKREYGIEFPADLMNFYSVALPISRDFYNWRDFSTENIKKIKHALDRPFYEIYKMVDEVYWCEDWGVEPDKNERSSIIKYKLENAPKLIPIFSHRYMPMINRKNVPIFSICNTDVIYYGENLESYFEIEFGNKKQSEIEFERIEPIPFWSDLL